MFTLIIKADQRAPVFQVVLSSSTEEVWEAELSGLNARDIAMNVALPEVDGRVLTRAISFKGEAFFDVAENKNELFIVKSNGINVEVYGTKFNVRNYSEDFNSDIVLVEGSVGINNSEVSELTMLKPGFKGSVDKENFRVTTSKVNTKIYTSWIGGEVIFRNETFSQILKKLERKATTTCLS